MVQNVNRQNCPKTSRPARRQRVPTGARAGSDAFKLGPEASARHELVTAKRSWVEGDTGSDVESLRSVDLGAPGVVPCVEYLGEVAPRPFRSSPRGCRVPMEGERG